MSKVNLLKLIIFVCMIVLVVAKINSQVNYYDLNLTGTYVNEEFNENIHKNHSAIKASALCDQEFIIITDNISNIMIYQNYGFHTGGLERNLFLLNKFMQNRLYQNKSNNDNLKINILDRNRIEVIQNNEKDIFIKIDIPFIEFVNKNTLAGEYTDTNCDKILFSESGNIFLNGSFIGSYVQDLDEVFNAGLQDTFKFFRMTNSGLENLKDGSWYIVELTGNIIKIFDSEAIYESLHKKSIHPLYILKKDIVQ